MRQLTEALLTLGSSAPGSRRADGAAQGVAFHPKRPGAEHNLRMRDVDPSGRRVGYLALYTP